MKQVYIWCEVGNHLIRTDDGSYCAHYRKAHARNVESVMVVFRGPNGQISIPWEPDAPCPPGYAVEEVRGTRAVRQLEKELDKRDIARYRRHQAKLEAIFAPQRQQRREDLKQIIREGQTTVKNPDGTTRTIRVSELGRAIAREALRRSESGYSRRYDPGNHRDGS